jgi:hypothetical protein
MAVPARHRPTCRDCSRTLLRDDEIASGYCSVHKRWFYKCLRCGFTSYNDNDVRERYCGNCHRYERD